MNQPTTASGATPGEVRAALRRMASSVCIISCAHAGQRFAMAATAVSALSMDPPSMVVAVNRAASIHDTLRAAPCFAINVLATRHEAISRACGGEMAGTRRFEVGDWSEDDRTGVPVLSDAQVMLICKPDGRFEYGSHSLIIGWVMAVRQSGDLDPLIYVDGRYSHLAA